MQKAGVPGSPGYLKHSSMIWHTTQEAKRQKKDLNIVWVDLANAYGSVPHALIEYAMDFFWIPERVKDYVMKYYEEFQMWFSTGEYTIHMGGFGGWHSYGMYYFSNLVCSGYGSYHKGC